MDVTSDSVSLSWQRPIHVPGLLQGYNVEIQKLERNCEPEQHMESCVESELVEWVEGETSGVTLSPLPKYREYRIRLVAFTTAGAGEPSDWIHTQTLAGSMLNMHTHIPIRKTKITNEISLMSLMFILDSHRRLLLEFGICKMFPQRKIS